MKGYKECHRKGKWNAGGVGGGDNDKLVCHHTHVYSVILTLIYWLILIKGLGNNFIRLFQINHVAPYLSLVDI